MAVAPQGLTAIASIPVGQYVTTKVAGMTVDLDTVWASAVAGLVVIGLGLAVRRSATAHEVPGRLQLLWEGIVGAVQNQVEQTVGPRSGPMVPLAITLFVFILVANWLEILPSGAVTVALPSPTADANTCYAMAIFVFLVYNVAGLRHKGLLGFLRRFVRPYKVLLPINIIEEISKPVTLSLRLFGNMFSGGLMIALLAVLFPFEISWIPTVGWKLFDMFIGLIQAFIFALLAIIYYQMAISEEH
ncbi:MAG: F0F1 ATP synthase subunit A [Acidimicrobiales bacterium]